MPTVPLSSRSGRLFLCLLALSAGCSSEPTTPPKAAPAGPVVAADWPRMFGPTNDARTTETVSLEEWTPAGPPEVWRREVGGGYGTPVVADGLVVLLHRVGDEERVDAFDAATGEPRWSHAYPTDYVCSFEYDDGPYGSPVIHGGRVYTVGGTWQARCLDLADGSVVWSRDLEGEYPLERDGFPFGAGLWVDDERVVFNLGSPEAGVIALDAATGKTLWTATDHRAGYATPRYAEPGGEPTLYVFTFRGLVALDPRTGAERWFEKFKSSSSLSYNSTTPIVSDGWVLLVTGPGPGAKLLKTPPGGPPETAWADRRVLDSQFNTLMPDGEHVYGYTSSRNLQASVRCVEIATGELKWSYQSDLKRGTGLIARDKLLLFGEFGHLAVAALNPEEFEPLYFSDAPLLDEPTYASPVLARGLLYLRNVGNLVCYRARPAGD